MVVQLSAMSAERGLPGYPRGALAPGGQPGAEGVFVGLDVVRWHRVALLVLLQLLNRDHARHALEVRREEELRLAGRQHVDHREVEL